LAVDEGPHSSDGLLLLSDIVESGEVLDTSQLDTDDVPVASPMT
jgi:hypothetical protein